MPEDEIRNGTPAPPPGSRSHAEPLGADAGWMRLALEEAHRAAALGEVPVGAVVVCGGVAVARTHNLTYTAPDPVGHAELLALRLAAERRGDARLTDCTLYVTLEPCAMCSGAIVLARVERVVFGAYDPKAGMCGSLANVVQDPRLNHRAELLGGVLADECSALLRDFFRQRRRGGD